MNEHFDVIIIGTGAGGGSLLNRLAPSGKRILVLERGPFLPREKENWSYKGSFKYYSSEVMFNKDGGEIRPGFSYHVGGNTKVYGAALFRLREKDFESFRHRDGISPEWPIKYRDWENYYTQAEQLFQVHGKAGEDPTEPWRAKEYPFPPISHEPRIAEVFRNAQSARVETVSRTDGCATQRSDAASQRVHPLRHLRRLSMHDGREVGCGRSRRPSCDG